MATRDFRSQQIRTTQIIASGSDTASKPSLLIYSSSAATNDQGAYSAAMIEDVDNKAWLFVSGSTNADDKQNVSFGGNVGISGSLTGSSITTFPGSSLTLSSADNLNFVIDNDGNSTSKFSFKASSSASEIAKIDESGNLQIDGDLTLDGGNIKNSDAQVAISIDANANTTLAGALRVPDEIQHVGDLTTKIGFDTESVKTTAGGAEITNATAARFIVNEQNLNLDFEVRSDADNTRAIHVDASENTVKFLDTTNLSLASMPGGNNGGQGGGRDINFFVRGIPGAHQAMVDDPSTVVKGVSVFTGDVVVSGTLYAEKQVLEVDMVQSGSNLILSSSLHFKDSGPGAGSNFPIPPKDGSIFVSTGSLIAKLADADGNTTEVKIGQNYLAGNGITDTTVNPNTTFHMSIDAFSGSLTSGLQTSDAIAIMDDSEANNATKKMTLANFFTETADNGLKYDSTTVGYKTDDAVVAHLTGSEFNGHVGVTGSFGVDGDISIDSGHVLYLNGRGGDVFIQGTDNELLIDVDDTLNVKADATITLEAAGNNKIQMDATRTQVNRESGDYDFAVHTQNEFGTLFLDAADDSTIIGAKALTSTPAASQVPGYEKDVRIMLSGSAGSKDLTTRGVVLLPGDAVVSGTLFYANDASSESYISHPRNGLSRDLSIGQRALELSLQSITGSAAIAKTDSLAFIDQDASNATKKGTIDSLVTALAGSGLSNSSSQLALTSNSLTVTAGDGLKDGGSVNLGGSVTLNIEPNDFAGTGLEDDGSDNLRISAAAAGNGINGGGGSALSVDDGIGLKIGSSNELKTDDAIVAHLSGSEFNGNVGITGSLGVVGDISLAAEDYLYLNGLGGDVRLRGYADALDIDGDNNLRLYSDSSTLIDVGNNDTMFSTDKVEFNTNNNDIDFEVNTDTYNATLFVDGGDDSVILGAQHFTDTPSASDLAAKGYGKDVKIMLSGSKNTMGTTTRGVVLVPGDLVVSGTLADGAGNRINLLSVKENGTFSTAPQATATNSVAIGNDAQATTGAGAFAIGNKTRATGARSIALGSAEGNNTASGISAAALGGEGITASGDFSAVLGGQNNTASGEHSAVIGRESTASGNRGIAIGNSLTVPEADTIALGSGTNHAQKIVASGSFEVTGSATIDGNVTLAGSDGDVTLGNNAELIIPTFIKHKADTNTYFQFNVDRIRLVTNGVSKSDFTTDQVLFLSGGNSTSPDPAAGTDVNFFVSGSIGSKGTATKGTGVFGGDVHISGALSGPSQYALTDNTVRIFRDANTMKFDDGENVVKTLSDLASLPASTDFFVGVHGGDASTSKLKATSSVAFSGDHDSYVDGLSAHGVGQDVFVFFSGSIGSKDGTTRGVTLFGGDTVFSGSTGFTNVAAANNVVATGSLIAGGNVIKNSNGNSSLRFNPSDGGVFIGAQFDTGAQSLLDVRKDDNTIVGSSNEYSNYNLALRNHSTTTNAFAGIAFDVAEVEDADTIGASIAALRDSTADADNHRTNLVFMTNNAGDAGLTEALRITADGKVGIGVVSPSRALDVNGDVMIRGNDILDSGGNVIFSFDGSGNLDIVGNVTQATTQFTDVNISGGDLIFGNGQNATVDVADVSGTDTAGKNLSILAGAGTGTGVGGQLEFKVAPAAGSSGAGVNAHSTILTLPSTGIATFAGSIQIPNGESLRNGDGETVITIDANQNVTVAGDLTVSGNDIKDSGGTVLTFDGSQNTTLGGGLSFSSAQGITGSLRTEKSSDVIFSANSGGLNIDKSHAFFLDASAGNIGVGTASPTSKLHIVTDQNVGGENGGDNSIVMETVNASNNGAFIFRRAAGTIGSETAAGNSAKLGSIVFEGHDGTDFEPAAAIRGEVSYTSSGNNDMPGLLSFLTTADGASSLTERAVINHNGQLIINPNGTWVGQASEKLLVRNDWNSGNTPASQFGVYNGASNRLEVTVDPTGNVGFGFSHASNDKLAVSGSLKVEQTLELDGPIIGNGASNIQISHTGVDGDNGLLFVREDSSTTANELLGGIGFDSTDGNVPSSILEASAFIAGYAAETHSTGDKGGYLVLGTSAINDNDDTVSNEVMRIGSDRLVTLQGDIQLGGTQNILASDGIAAITLDSSNATVKGVLTIGADADGVDRKLRFGHTTIKSVIGIDDSQDVFAINTDQDFENSNDFEIDEQGNVTIGNGNLIIDGGEVRGAPSGQLKLYADTNVCINIDVDGSGTDALFKVQTNSQDTKFEIDESGNVLLDGDLTVSGGDIIGPTDSSLTIKADQNLIFQVDADGGNSSTFQFKNSDNSEIASLSEAGSLQIDGDLTVSGGDIFGPTNSDLRIRSDADVKIYLDDDNDGTNTFDILNGSGTTITSINESGHIDCNAVHVGSSLQTSRSTFEGTTSSTTGDSIVLIKHAATSDSVTKVALDVKQGGTESTNGGDYDFDSSEIFIQFTDGDDNILGDIDNEVTYNNFTGAHLSYHASMNVNDDSWQDTWRRGMILRSSGVLLSEPGGMSTALVGVEITDSKEDKRVIGVFKTTGINHGDRKEIPADQKRYIRYNALGEGSILVTDSNGNIENGDYICASNVLGCGEKQADDILHSYTVAKATTGVDWSTVEAESDGIKRKLIACTYHCG